MNLKKNLERIAARLILLLMHCNMNSTNSGFVEKGNVLEASADFICCVILSCVTFCWVKVPRILKLCNSSKNHCEVNPDRWSGLTAPVSDFRSRKDVEIYIWRTPLRKIVKRERGSASLRKTTTSNFLACVSVTAHKVINYCISTM